MASQHAREPGSPTPQQAHGDTEMPHRLRNLLGARLDREVYLSTDEAAKYAGRPSREAFIKWARRAGIPLRTPKGCRTISVKKGDIDFALRG